MSFRAYLYVYLFGGVTFIPLVLGLLLLYVHTTLPRVDSTKDVPKDDPSRLTREGDEKIILKTGTDDLAEKFHRKHESDVAAGYFAVCREYVPGGVNGKPPEIKSPASDVVASESPSVYQTMYRSIFERNQKPSIEPNKDGAGKTVKRANNVFYVVLRHGHLMLYDDIQQLEVRYVISLEYHDVDVYAGGDRIPEPELWIKRNAIRLKRKKVQAGDKTASSPFFLFSENQSEKEDFYFAMLNNMQKTSGENPPLPQEFETSHIITLVQRLHSSEEQLQTRWLNALLGRLFLAVYKTPELEAHIRKKLTKKISRAKKPDFITKLALQKIDTGTGAPFFTNPRLRDLTVNGDCTVEADVEYTGNFRVEIAATVRIDLGKRLGAREVDIVLAATVRKLQGHLLGRLKPPPSNRIWFSFEKVPKMELKLEPIVSSRQVTYGFILRAIENRILEVITETLVLPHWDDLPFTLTESELFRGGIWKKDVQPPTSTEIKDEVAEDEAEAGSSTDSPKLVAKDERIMSMPVLTDHSKAATAAARKSVTSLRDLAGTANGSKTPDRPYRQQGPRILRAPSFASTADPMVSPNHAPAESSPMDIQATSKRDSMLKDISARSLGTSPESEREDPHMSDSDRNRANSLASNLTSSSGKVSRRGTTESESTLVGSIASGKTNESLESKRSSVNGEGKIGLAAAAKTFANSDRQDKLASINAAREAAQKWGWGVLARKRQHEAGVGASAEQENKHDTSQPMGRGQPLPPPGMPLPKPAKPSMFALPKRRPVPAPPTPRDGSSTQGNTTPSTESPPKAAPPPLPERNRRQSYKQHTEGEDDELLVVAAPQDSAPATPAPVENEHHDEFFGHGEDDRSLEQKNPKKDLPKYAPPLPSRRPESREEDTVATSFDEILGRTAS
ncbi:hypothetical protein OHC33_002957 [Knufia fluminis]|uniref:SMP-LTD domain-containing protein n=1 Tax=Knufia fluminis TaxID=191047 RepID=A0AAN8ELC1_9EURO|nr:hypothetical protein OHC33_002957 [Knufia fluminis]